MNFLIAGIALIAGWKWSDWRNWEKYYPTILFMIVGNFLYNILTYNHPMWLYEKSLLPNHTMIDILHSFVVFPVTIMLYLTYFPESNLIKKIRYILFWTAIYISMEWLLSKLELFSYHNGWNILWSAGFNITMFTILWVHHKKPLLAWFFSFFIILFLVIFFEVPIGKMR